MAYDENDTNEASLRDYVRVVVRRRWVVIATVVILFVLAMAYSLSRTPMYEASTTLIYEISIDVSDPLSVSAYIDPTQREVELGSVAAVIASPDLIQRARDEIGEDVDVTAYSVSAVPGTASGSSEPSTAVISAIGPDPKVAATIAEAYADAFVAYRKEQEREQIREAEDVIQSKLDTFNTSAERESSEYATLLQRLHDLQIREDTATGNFRVLIPASPPSEPVSPQPAKTGGLALAGGLVLGIGLAILLEQLDTRVRSSAQVAEIFGLPVLGKVRRLSSRAIQEQPLLVLAGGHDPAAESIRKLRGNLEYANIDGDLKSFVLTSALQHEGKTLTICNLALSIAATGVRVVLVDADLRRPQVHTYMKLPNALGVSTVLTGKTSLKQALRTRPFGVLAPDTHRAARMGVSTDEGVPLYVLTSGPAPPNPAEVVASRSFAELIRQLERDFDLVIVDAPSILAVGDPASIARVVDGLVFLVDLAQAKRPVLEEAAAQLEQIQCRKLGLVLLGHTPRYGKSGDSYSYYYAE